MTGAIEFLKHAREMCNKKICGDRCPFRKDKECTIYCNNCQRLRTITDNEIADIVREVERWWKENENG